MRRLRKAMGLAPALWPTLAWHVRNGLADFQRELGLGYAAGLELDDAPPEWFEDPVALGYVTLRVLREGRAEWAVPVGDFFLRFCDPVDQRLPPPPGLGLAWVRLDQLGRPCPIASRPLAWLAFDEPKPFFQGVLPEELADLARLVLQNLPDWEAWHLHLLFTAVDVAATPQKAVARLFRDLMEAPWVPRARKREFCRGLLGCPPEMRRLEAWNEQTESALGDDCPATDRVPRMAAELGRRSTADRFPRLGRHAVVALATEVGEPPEEVAAEFLIQRPEHDRFDERVRQGALDVVRTSANHLEPATVRDLLAQAIKTGSAPLRKSAYRIGLKVLGPSFALPALDDPATSIQNWAADALAKVLHHRRRRRRGRPG